jgi:hypothetical protein
VYATFTGPLPFPSRLWAALLHAGADAVASHLSAGHLQGLVDEAPTVVDVSVPDAHRVTARPGPWVHRARAHAVRRHPARSVPQTLVEDTVLDLVERWTTSASASRHPWSAVTARCRARSRPTHVIA